MGRKEKRKKGDGGGGRPREIARRKKKETLTPKFAHKKKENEKEEKENEMERKTERTIWQKVCIKSSHLCINFKTFFSKIRGAHPPSYSPCVAQARRRARFRNPEKCNPGSAADIYGVKMLFSHHDFVTCPEAPFTITLFLYESQKEYIWPVCEKYAVNQLKKH